jgi:LysR family transcriptional regulator for bpeEF and oprC
MADFLLAPMLQDGRIQSILEDWTNEPLPIHVVYPQNRHLSAKVRVFVDWVAQLFANHATLR